MLELWILQQAPRAVTFVDLTKEKDPSLAWLILSTFGFIAVLLLVTAAIGAGIGMLRIWIARRFPTNAFNGLEDEPHVRLHLSSAYAPAAREGDSDGG